MDEASTSLGKRKEREEGSTESKPHGSTVFVSNLPYSVTSTDLNTLFSDLGPVRSAFVVLDQGSGSSKGVGYVSFAIREDAEATYDKANGGSDPIVLEDPLAIRTIVVSGLPTSIDSKALWKKVRKYKGAEKVDWPIQKDGLEDKSTAHVLFSTPAAAQEAVSKLHAHVFKGALLSVTLKKRLDGLAKPSTKPSKSSKQTPALDADMKTPAANGASGPAPSRASRLIVRNLPWNVTEQDLRAVFLPYGPIYSIHIPVKEPEAKSEDSSERSKLRAKGYAFVWMLSKKDAEAAIEGANGTRVRAGMAEALVRDKQKKKKLLREEKKFEKARKEREAKQKGKDGKVEDEEEEDEEKGSDEEGEEDEMDVLAPSAERVIAVDWALSKDKWEEAKAKIQEENDEKKEADEDANEDESGSDASSDEEDGHIGVHHGDSDEEGSNGSRDDDEMNVDEEEENPGKPQLPPPETGTTLFVRNVPFEATEDELRTTFRAFGPLRYARITMDHETGRSRGTGFVCFWNKADADKAIEQSDILRQETTGGDTSAPKKNPFTLPSLLTPDPSASMAQNLVLQGRTLDVIRAVTRDEAGKLKEAGERQREKADKRNLYLLREGLILPNTPAAQLLSATEVENRTQSFNARRALLRSNPSLYVSRTRLSVRQLPLFVSERMLKRLAIHAVRAFQAEVKAGTRTGLTEDELTEIVEGPDEDEDESHSVKGKDKAKGKAKGRNTGVKQAKVVRQQDRVDPVTGKGRSRGYGFLEMGKHADALRVLRWANNNPEVSKLVAEWWKEELEDLVKLEKKKEKKEEGRLERLKNELEQGPKKNAKGSLIVEFSIENVQVVKRRAAHQQEQKTVPSDTKKPSRRMSLTSVKTEKEEEQDHPRKKRRTSEPQPKPSTLKSDVQESQESPKKQGTQIGSLIGRKRKERKGKKRTS
ncbi:unnamed protein product [Somion occarium]|uniref:RRM domain-containing protein n=1 Tax=Somion occarium TaxID=3059160 RepID=A0ABP1DTG5_9APHY